MEKKLFKRKFKKNFFSIICATYNTDVSIFKLCNSLAVQKYKKFELIVCDQNNKGNLKKKLHKFKKKINYKYFNTKIGLSLSRNFGIKKSRGNFLLFLDDDIEMPNNFLFKLNKLLNIKKNNILCFKVKNKKDKKDFFNYPSKSRFIINEDEIFKFISSVSFVIKKNLSLYFDNNLGLGSNKMFLSGEESDLLLRLFKNKNKIYFNNSIFLIHQEKKLSFLKEMKKSFYYGCGWSYVVKKNKMKKSFIFKNIIKIFLNFIFHLITFNFIKTFKSICTFSGRIYGLK